ncbi:MAG: DUF4375 domain-containing protein [Burkholderiales bacterium]|nr:DUF4375 domain-containing protein [Burkholderiales bacterium]
MYFFGDTHNGGLHQTMTNSTGELSDVVVEFADKYGTPELRQVMWEIVGLFPDRHVPSDREEREQIVDAMADADHLRMDHLSSQLCGLDAEMRAGLLALLKEHQSSFTLTSGYG